MKATLLRDEEMINPAFLANPQPGMQQRLIVPEGTVIDTPTAWQLCTLTRPKAVPADDECRERVAKFLGSERRQNLLRQVAALRKAEGVKQLDAKTAKWLRYMEAAYEKDLEALELNQASATDSN